uniref:Uncharacterized protein n=1 Tax=Arundo donax TaxID=35708 RepID=A0A0A9E4F7_ARUDO
MPPVVFETRSQFPFNQTQAVSRVSTLRP